MHHASSTHGRRPRRGVTLIEMLVVVALLVLMMTILASIFQVATGAISSSRTYQELDNNLRLLDQTIRQDLAGVTARMTPPLNPSDKLGYFEYGENAPADSQGEDTDDYLAFTAKAPEGQAFTGRIWVPYTAGVSAVGVSNYSTLPVTVTSHYAEIIYFLRNGNLYRRVLLIMPERRGQLAFTSGGFVNVFTPAMFSTLPVSFMGVNDISVHPNSAPFNGSSNNSPNGLVPIPNDLGDLTNRENRFARPRFGNDFHDINGGGAIGRDGIVDDGNGDGVPDYWPTLTATQIAYISGNSSTNIQGLINEDSNSTPGAQGGNSYARVNAPNPQDIYAFPFVNPGMYSKAETSSIGSSTGLLHALDTRTIGGAVPSGASLNHAALEIGDSLPAQANVFSQQSWFGFPTWRETASIHWSDPVYTVSTGHLGIAAGNQMYGLQQSGAVTNFPPPLGSMPPLGIPSSYAVPFGSDNAGNLTPGSAFVNSPVALASATFGQLCHVWEDDLIMTGVRSFDVKALDQAAQVNNSSNVIGNSLLASYNVDYYDLGYAATDYANIFGNNGVGLQFILGTPYQIQDGNFNPQGFGHEGRMPPNSLDYRVDAQRPVIKSTTRSVANLPGGVVNNLLGDDHPGLVRMRRVWDSWSTDYTNAPAIDVNLRGSPIQAAPLDQPIYPSYPAPYPQALRGIQIQIRVTDGKNEKVKILTIRQDFSDKL